MISLTVQIALLDCKIARQKYLPLFIIARIDIGALFILPAST